MSYQCCPICNGSGYVSGFGTATFSTCTVCRGAKIIDEVTGLPPAHVASTGVNIGISYAGTKASQNLKNHLEEAVKEQEKRLEEDRKLKMFLAGNKVEPKDEE